MAGFSLKNVLSASVIAGALALLTAPASATFMIDPTPGGIKMYNDVANKDVSTFAGYVGCNNSSCPLITINTTGNVDTGSGYSNIKPANKDQTLTVLTFLPADTQTWGDFSFRGQLEDLAGGTVTLEVTDGQGNPSQTFTFSGLGSNADFGRIGIVSTDGETIAKIVLTSNFKEEKQNEFSIQQSSPTCPPGTVGTPPDCHVEVVPEPTSLLILGSALFGFGVLRRQKHTL